MHPSPLISRVIALALIALGAVLVWRALVADVASAARSHEDRLPRPAWQSRETSMTEPKSRQPAAPMTSAATGKPIRTAYRSGSGHAQTIAARAAADLALSYETAVDKRLLYDALRESGASDSFYFTAEILRDCVGVAEHGLAAVVDRFLSNLPLYSPDLGDQIAAFRRLIEPCTGFDGRPITSAEIELLQLAGVQRGDPRSIAHRLATLGVEHGVDSILVARALLDLDDPYVISGVSRFLSEMYAQGPVIDGAALSASEHQPVAMAWTLVACDYGAACGANNAEVLRACAHSGSCGIQSLDELHLTFAEPETYRRGLHYRERILIALQHRDYASLGLSERSASPANSQQVEAR